jgi:hypothetical protein
VKVSGTWKLVAVLVVIAALSFVAGYFAMERFIL